MNSEPNLRNFRFSLRALFLFLFAVCGLLAMFRPLGNINRVSCNRIHPGMTIREAEKIIGTRRGIHDGIREWSSEAPGYKGEDVYWLGSHGLIQVRVDNSGVISQADFYPVRVMNWSMTEWFFERLFRVHVLDLSPPQLLAAFTAISTLGIWAIGMVFILPDNKNSAALHGAIGLPVGLLAGVVLLSGLYVWGLFGIFLLGMSPVGGAILGMLVGFLRSAVSWRVVAPNGEGGALSPK